MYAFSLCMPLYDILSLWKEDWSGKQTNCLLGENCYEIYFLLVISWIPLVWTSPMFSTWPQGVIINKFYSNTKTPYAKFKLVLIGKRISVRMLLIISVKDRDSKVDNNLDPCWHSLSRSYRLLIESQDTQVLDRIPPDCNFESRVVNKKKTFIYPCNLTWTIQRYLSIQRELVNWMRITPQWQCTVSVHDCTHSPPLPLSLYHRWNNNQDVSCHLHRKVAFVSRKLCKSMGRCFSWRNAEIWSHLALK